MPTNSKEYQKEYMRNYIKNSGTTHCDLCGGNFKTYNKHVHVKCKKHINAMKILKDSTVLEKDLCKQIFDNKEFQNKLRTYIIELKKGNDEFPAASQKN